MRAADFLSLPDEPPAPGVDPLFLGGVGVEGELGMWPPPPWLVGVSMPAEDGVPTLVLGES